MPTEIFCTAMTNTQTQRLEIFLTLCPNTGCALKPSNVPNLLNKNVNAYMRVKPGSGISFSTKGLLKLVKAIFIITVLNISVLSFWSTVDCYT